MTPPPQPGQGGSLRNFLTQNLIFMVTLSPCKISEPYDDSFWEKSKPAEEERKKEK
jgi:hypothetical protein